MEQQDTPKITTKKKNEALHLLQTRDWTKLDVPAEATPLEVAQARVNQTQDFLRLESTVLSAHTQARQARIQQLPELKERFEQMSSKLGEQLARATKHIKQQTAELKSKAEQVLKMEREQKTAEEAVASAQRELKAANEASKTAGAKVEDLESKLKQAKMELEQAQKERGEVEQKLTDSVELVKQLQSQPNSTKESHDGEMQALRTTYEDDLKKLRAAHEEALTKLRDKHAEDCLKMGITYGKQLAAARAYGVSHYRHDERSARSRMAVQTVADIAPVAPIAGMESMTHDLRSILQKIPRSFMPTMSIRKTALRVADGQSRPSMSFSNSSPDIPSQSSPRFRQNLPGLGHSSSRTHNFDFTDSFGTRTSLDVSQPTQGDHPTQGDQPTQGDDSPAAPSGLQPPEEESGTLNIDKSKRPGSSGIENQQPAKSRHKASHSVPVPDSSVSAELGRMPLALPTRRNSQISSSTRGGASNRGRARKNSSQASASLTSQLVGDDRDPSQAEIVALVEEKLVGLDDINPDDPEFGPWLRDVVRKLLDDTNTSARNRHLKWLPMKDGKGLWCYRAHTIGISTASQWQVGRERTAACVTCSAGGTPCIIHQDDFIVILPRITEPGASVDWGDKSTWINPVQKKRGRPRKSASTPALQAGYNATAT